MFNHELLESKLKVAGMTHAALASYLGMSKTNMSSIWHDRQPWQMKHVVPIAVRLSLSPQDVWDIFFADEYRWLSSPAGRATPLFPQKKKAPED